MATQRNFGLDVVRAIAITLVLVSHCSLLFYTDSQPLIKTILMLGGTLGVDIFFVLSGYLIGGLLLNLFENNNVQAADIKYFWIRRWFRTLPNYFLALVVNCFLGVLLFKQIPDDVSSYFYFFQNFNYAQSDFFTESWSLSIEEFSYLFTPIVIMLFYSIKKNGKLAFLLGTLLLIGLAQFFRFNYHFNETNINYHYWTTNVRKVVIYRIDAICYGFLAIYAVRYYRKFIEKYTLQFFFLGGLSLIGLHLIIFVFTLTPTSSPLLYNIFYFPIIGLAFASMHWHMTKLNPISRKIEQLIKFISTRSYAIYLMNYSIVLLSMNYLEIQQSLHISKLVTIIIYLGLTFIVSEIVYRYFEKPLMNLRNHRIFRTLRS